MRTLLGASVKMVVRDHQAIFWALMFPMILLGVFRLFSPGAGETSDVLLVADTQTRAGAAVAQALQHGQELLDVRPQAVVAQHASHEHAGEPSDGISLHEGWIMHRWLWKRLVLRPAVLTSPRCN